MPAGRVDKRFTERSGKWRLRFYSVAPDHLEVVLAALQAAREEIGTEYDSVALDAICVEFLASRLGKPKPTLGGSILGTADTVVTAKGHDLETSKGTKP